MRSQKQIKKNKIKTSKDRISQMIILNGVNYLLFKMPSALISFYGFFYRSLLSYRFDKREMKHVPNLIDYIIFKKFRFCEGLSDIFFFFYLNSLIFQFLIFYNLDKNFKINLDDNKQKFKDIFLKKTTKT